MAAVGLGFCVLRLQLGSLRGLGCCCLLFRLVQLSGGHEDGQLGQPVLRGLIARRDEYLGVEVRVCIARHLADLECVLVAVVGDDVNVRRDIRHFRLYADKAAGDVASIKCPVHLIAGEDIGDLFLAGSMMSVDCSKAARMDGGASASDTVTVRGAAGSR